MIVVAIIGILVSIALPAYEDYMGRTQVTSALADINPGKVQYEYLLADSANGAAAYTPAGVGLGGTTPSCLSVTVTAPNPDGSATPAIACTIRGKPDVNGKLVQIERAINGSWSCKSNAPRRFYIPNGCTSL